MTNCTSVETRVNAFGYSSPLGVYTFITVIESIATLYLTFVLFVFIHRSYKYTRQVPKLHFQFKISRNTAIICIIGCIAQTIGQICAVIVVYNDNSMTFKQLGYLVVSYYLFVYTALFSLAIFQVTRVYFVFKSTVYAIGNITLTILIMLLFSVAVIITVGIMSYSLSKHNRLLGMTIAFLFALIVVVITQIIVASLFADKLLKLTVNMRNTMFADGNSNYNPNSNYNDSSGNSINSDTMDMDIVLTQQQESDLKIVVKQTLLMLLQALLFLLNCVGIAMYQIPFTTAKHGWWNYKGDFKCLTLTDWRYITCSMDCICVIVWITCLCLSFKFADKEYFMLCSKCDKCFFYLCEKCAINRIRQNSIRYQNNNTDNDKMYHKLELENMS